MTRAGRIGVDHEESLKSGRERFVSEVDETPGAEDREIYSAVAFVDPTLLRCLGSFEMRRPEPPQFPRAFLDAEALPQIAGCGGIAMTESRRQITEEQTLW